MRWRLPARASEPRSWPVPSSRRGPLLGLAERPPPSEKDAERISSGVLLQGPGAVFMRELGFDAVDTEVTSTALVGSLRAQAR